MAYARVSFGVLQLVRRSSRGPESELITTYRFLIILNCLNNILISSFSPSSLRNLHFKVFKFKCSGASKIDHKLRPQIMMIYDNMLSKFA